MSHNEYIKRFSDQIKQAHDENSSVFIRGGASKAFLMDAQASSEILDLSDYCGIISYEPSELVITLRAGTLVKSVVSMLSSRNQCFPFEPPILSEASTVGGMVASGFSGPSRPFTGSLRDAVLGVKMLNGKGEVLKFGGEVIKNVAGYDISRLMAGSFGTLGAILEVSIKVIPKPKAQATVVLKANSQNLLSQMHKLRQTQPNINGLAAVDSKIYCRVGCGETSVSYTTRKIGGEILEEGEEFWNDLNNQTHPFFQSREPLWRLSLAPATKSLLTDSSSVFDWGGALRWVKADIAIADVQHLAKESHGSAMPFFRGKDVPALYSLPGPLFHLHNRVKHSLDPKGIFDASGFVEEQS